MRRRLVDGRLDVEVRRGGAWQRWTNPATDPLGLPRAVTEEFEVTRAAGKQDPDGTTPVLPFTPLSFRDFMLYEEHAVAAARGIARRYLPAANTLATAYERLTRRTFPRFRPAPLWYAQPIYYMGNALTIHPSGTPVRAPSYSRDLDYELELGFVINQPLHDATPEQAEAAIGGFVVLNDFSARDVQLAEMRSGFGPQKAKHFTTSVAVTAVPASAVADPTDLDAEVRVNCRIVTRTSTRGMRHTLGEALAHASRGEQLHPGELFATGTLPGGSGLENDTMLHPGDHLELVIHGVGRIEHDIVGAGEPQ